MSNTSTQGERIRAVEVQVTQLISETQDMSKKLDDLLALRDKGAGVFWVASAIFGTGILGTLITFIQWWRG